MVLSSIMPEMLMYGFLGTAMTRNPAFPLLVTCTVYVMQTVFFMHRNDPEPLDAHVTITEVGMTVIGAIVLGMPFVVFAGTPKFVNTDVLDSRGRFNPWAYLIVLLTSGTSLGVYFWEAGDVAIGVTLVVVFGLATLGLLAVYFFANGFIENGVSQGKYLVLFSLLVTAAASYDYPLTQTTNQSIRPWQTLIFSGVLLVVYAIFALFTLLDELVTPTEKVWYRPMYNGAKSMKARQWFVILLLFGVHVLIYVPAMIADEVGAQEFGVPAATTLNEEKKIFYVLWAILSSSAAILIIMAIWFYTTAALGLHLTNPVSNKKLTVLTAPVRVV